MKIEEGYSYQEYEPTPDNPCGIKSKNLKGLNLLHQFEVNGITYTDNIPSGFNIGITKEQYVKYQQLESNWKELKKWLEKTLNELKENDVYDRTSYETGQIIATECIIAKMQELESENNE